MILWDAQGETRFIASIPEEGISSPEEVEFVAILRGLQFCAGMEINKLILESDCSLMLKECLSAIIPLYEVGSLVIEIKKMQEGFVECQLQLIFREQNKPIG